MSKDRPRRVGELIQRELAEMIPRELVAPELGLVTISSVDVSPDLKNAKVYFTVLGGQWDAKESQAYLQEGASQLRFLLSKRMTTRVTPKLDFQFDQSLENGIRMEALLHGLRPAPTESTVQD